MKTDFSKLLYDRYFHLNNRKIEVKLKSGFIVACIIIGFYKASEEDDHPYIKKWHISTITEKNALGINSLDILNGNTIDQDDIAEVKFMEDGSVLKFFDCD
ncbi:MAG TPA: hypothetical protein VFT78_10215 [Hanamia sp.]|nr:hypothetical protein [Hanamia sp.]